MKVAVIGTGISGLSAAYYLREKFDLVAKPLVLKVFERDERIGGHTATKCIEWKGEQQSIDTGFIVFNDKTYPNFIALMNELGVQSQPTRMSFSVVDAQRNYEYAGTNFKTLFAQFKNVFSVRHWRMLLDIVRFNRRAIADLESGSVPEDITLGDYVLQQGYSKGFVEDYLVPMGAAIWSASFAQMSEFPMLFFLRFFKNHGLLQLKDRPQWRVIKGGSRAYLPSLINSFKDDIETMVNISAVNRRDDGRVEVTFAEGTSDDFDAVIFACHSDQALSLLAAPTESQTEILSAIPYQENDVVMHTDIGMLPSNPSAWSCWNYNLSLDREGNKIAKLTYNMNLLQGLDSQYTYCVSLNQGEAIDNSKVIGRYRYAHPVFTLKGMQSQSRWQEIAGQDNIWFCGAYWRNGFHEDGVFSAKRAVDSLWNKFCVEQKGASRD